MSHDIPVATAPVSICYDPQIDPPPLGVQLWVVNPGGVGSKSVWYPGAIAWAHLPQLPATVKARLLAAVPRH